MTRDTWLRICAQRLIDKGGMETGEAVAYADSLAETQIADNGRNPNDWDSPGEVADEEISRWGD